jgi:Ca2+-transporting ATPase
MSRKNIPENIIGLTDEEVKASRKSLVRTNKFTNKQMVVSSFDLFKEPMLLLLIAVAVIYFVMGQNNEAYFMLAAIVVVSAVVCTHTKTPTTLLSFRRSG